MTTSSATRITARLDESRASKLEYLKRSTGLSVSEIVGRGIDGLYGQLQRGGADALEILEQTRFIGSSEGPGVLSERYEEALTEALEREHREGYARHPVEDGELDPW